MNPQVEKMLEEAKKQLAALKAEKTRLFPPNLHPLAEPDRYPGSYTPDQLAQHKALDSQIEMLEGRIDDLRLRLYSK